LFPGCEVARQQDILSFGGDEREAHLLFGALMLCHIAHLVSSRALTHVS
jgi:hypothetical protein